jgi:hypothetical protein
MLTAHDLDHRDSKRTSGTGKGVKTTIVFCLLLILFWLVWPYYVLYELSVAVQNGDSLELNERIAWTSVRAGLRADLNAFVLRELTPEQAVAVELFFPAMVNQFVDLEIMRQLIGRGWQSGEQAQVNLFDLSRI